MKVKGKRQRLLTENDDVSRLGRATTLQMSPSLSRFSNPHLFPPLIFEQGNSALDCAIKALTLLHTQMAFWSFLFSTPLGGGGLRLYDERFWNRRRPTTNKRPLFVIRNFVYVFFWYHSPSCFFFCLVCQSSPVALAFWFGFYASYLSLFHPNHWAINFYDPFPHPAAPVFFITFFVLVRGLSFSFFS